jgi:drug/metabolite transporter (DMT)-like permease
MAIGRRGDCVRQGIAYALASAVLFGISTPLAKSFLGDISPLLLAGLLYAGSGLGLLLFLAGRALLAPTAVLALPKRGEWPWLAGAIFLGGVAGPVALMYGLATTAASTTSLLLNLEAVFTALLAWFLFRENFDRRIALGIFAIVAGAAVLAWTPGDSGRASVGLVLIAAACLCWALDNNLTRKVSASDAVAIAALKGAVAGAVNLSLSFLLGQRLPSLEVTAGAAAIGLFGYGVSLVLFVLALRHLGSARAGAYFSVAPFFGAMLAVMMQGDPVTWRFLGAGGLMAAGVWLHLSERHDHVHEHRYREHTHTHVHDEHHRHTHDFDWDGHEPHVHSHAHMPLVHAHAHYPDLHHRHPH